MFGKDQGGYDYGYGIDDYLPPPPPPPPVIPPPPPVPAASWTQYEDYSPHGFSGSYGHSQYPTPYSAHHRQQVRQPPVPGEDYVYYRGLPPPPSPLSPAKHCLEPPTPDPSASAPLPPYRYPPPQKRVSPHHNYGAFPPSVENRSFNFSSPGQLKPKYAYEEFPKMHSSPHSRQRPPPFPEGVTTRQTYGQETFLRPSNYANETADGNVSKPSSVPSSTLNGSSKAHSLERTPRMSPSDVEHGGQSKPDATPDPIPDFARAPLQPPPMPPVFNWQNSNIKPPASIAELKVSEPNLPFIPIPADKIDLVQMTKVMEEEKAAANAATINTLKQQGIIEVSWPKSLIDLFQPLYCKLCTLTLSSAAVAMDHYKGKKHKKGITKWLYDHRNDRPQPLACQKRTIAEERNFRKTGVANWLNSSSAIPLSNVPQFQTESSAPPISGANALPLGDPGAWNIRRKESPNPGFHQTGPSKRFPLGRPPPKKAKTDPNSGPNFGYCDFCKVSLTSQQHFDQHYSGKNHKKKLKEHEQPAKPANNSVGVRVRGPRPQPFNLQQHEPYRAPTRPLIRPGLNVSFKDFRYFESKDNF